MKNLDRRIKISFSLTVLVLIVLTSALNLNAQIGIGAMPCPPKRTGKTVNPKLLLEDIKLLSSDEMAGRETGTPGSKRAQTHILRRFSEIGLRRFGKSFVQAFSYKHSNDGGVVNGANVVGWIKGSRNESKFLVITAHYDHDGVRRGEIYNGADDNASGTAALFAIADYFMRNRPAHSLLFVAFDAEEKGLRGSKHFVQNLPVRKSSIALNINMDMISRTDKNELYVSGAYHYPFIKRYVEPIKKDSKVKLLYGHDSPDLGRDDWTKSSDHGSFHAQKIPFIYFGVEDHVDYHKPSDTFEKINQKFYVDAVETIIRITRSIDENFKSE